MRIQDKNINISFGNAGAEKAQEKAGKAGKSNKSGGLTVFAGNTEALKSDSIEQKREQTKKKVAKVLMDQFDSDNAIKEEMDEKRQNIEKLQKEKSMIREMIDNTDSSDTEALKELNKQLNDVQNAIKAEDSAIAATRQASVKNTGMIKAVKAAEEIEKAGSDEIRGMLVQDAMEHIEEKQKEQAEAAEKAKEEKEEQEELQETAKEEKEENRELTEQIQESVTKQSDVDKELKKILQENEMLKEELKGIMVDESI